MSEIMILRLKNPNIKWLIKRKKEAKKESIEINKFQKQMSQWYKSKFSKKINVDIIRYFKGLAYDESLE